MRHTVEPRFVWGGHGARRFLRAPLLAVALGVGLSVTRHSFAQSCHVPPAAEPQATALVAVVHAETAAFDNERYEGHFEGIALALRLHTFLLDATASLPAYRIVRNGIANGGLGDLLLQTRVRLLHAREPADALGLELAATLPTGDSEHDLGMGHSMLMPAVWATAHLGAWGLSARTGYATALAAGGAHHHHAGGTSPLVDPMNSSELEAAIVGSFALSTLLALRAGTYGAVPVGAEDGSARAAGFAGAAVGGKRLATSCELHLPFAGDPFTGKLVLEVTLRL